MKAEQLYFLDSSQPFCRPLDYFDKEELEEVDYEIYEAIPDNSNKDYIFCTVDGEVGEREFCKKIHCFYYESKSGRGVCKHRGKLYEFGEKVNIKHQIGL